MRRSFFVFFLALFLCVLQFQLSAQGADVQIATIIKDYLDDDHSKEASRFFSSPETIKKYMTCSEFELGVLSDGYLQKKNIDDARKKLNSASEGISDSHVISNIKISNTKDYQVGSEFPGLMESCKVIQPIKTSTVTADYKSTNVKSGQPKTHGTIELELIQLDQIYIKIENSKTIAYD